MRIQKYKPKNLMMRLGSQKGKEGDLGKKVQKVRDP